MHGPSATVMQRLARWLAPAAPEAIRDEVERRQSARIQAYMPLLGTIAALNGLIVMAVCAHQGFAARSYLWMSGLVVLVLARALVWRRRRLHTLTPGAISASLRRSAWLTFGSLLTMGLFAAVTFVTGTFGRSTLIPISLAFGSMSMAHCFATLRPSAVAAVVLGIVPSSVAMLAVGDFEARVLGASMLSVVALMIPFVAGQFDLLVKEVLLQHEVHDLAHTDALTRLPNRRALMASLELDLARGPAHPVAVALLDLDGFKGVNDRLGHLAGDALLQVVAARLVQTHGAADTVGRLGGDEFLVIFRPDERGLDVDARVQTLLSALCQPTELLGEPVLVRASLGYALFPRHGQAPSALLAAADAALYADKRAHHASDEAEATGPSEDRRSHRTST